MPAVFSIVTPVYDPPADVLRAMLRSVTEPDLPRLGALPGRRLLAGARTWPRCSAPPPRPTPASAGRRRERQRRHRRRVATTRSGLATGEFVALLDHDDELHPEALRAASPRPSTDHARGRLRSTPTRTRSTSGGRRSAPVLQARLVARALAHADVHLPPQRAAPLAGRPRSAGSTASFEGSQDWDLVLRVTERARAVVHVPRGPVPLAHAGDLHRRAGRGGQALRLRGRDPGAPGPLRSDRASRPRSSADASTAASTTCARRCGTHPSVSIVIPTRREAARCEASGVASVSHCVRSIVDVSTYPDYEIVVRRRHHDPGRRARRAAATSAATGCGSSPYDRPFNFSDKINDGRARQRRRARADAQRRHGGRHPRLARAAGHVLDASRASARSGPSCCSATGACSTWA